MGDFVPVRPQTQRNLGTERSALHDLLAVAVVHERMGGRPTPFLLWSTLIADALLLLIVAVAAQFDPDGVRQSGLFPVGGNVPADLIGFLHNFTWVLLALALVGLALNAWCRMQRTPAWAHVLLAVQVVPTAAATIGWLVVGLMFVVAVALWVAFIGLMVVLCFAVLAALIAGASS